MVDDLDRLGRFRNCPIFEKLDGVGPSKVGFHGEVGCSLNASCPIGCTLGVDWLSEVEGPCRVGCILVIGRPPGMDFLSGMNCRSGMGCKPGVGASRGGCPRELGCTSEKGWLVGNPPAPEIPETPNGGAV